MLAKNIINNRKGFICFLVFAFCLAGLFASANETNAQGKKSFNLLVKINGAGDAVAGVSVELKGGDIDVPITNTVNNNGWVKFSKIKSGDYTLTPLKDGIFFTPASLDITVNETNKKRTLFTFQAGSGKPPDEGIKIPNQEEWAGSAHADTTAEAFNHWNEEGEIPVSCAKCHSTTGFRDFIGDDGSETGAVDKPVSVGGVITCDACHNNTAIELDGVTFPSGETVVNLGHEAICMQCHQGRASTNTVNDAIKDADVKDDDTVSEELGFINIHYFAAAATLYGKFAKGGYQYEGKAYDGRLNHVEGVDVCIDCHNPHTLKIKVDVCSACHDEVKTQDDVHKVRMNGSLVDYDGDGDMTEGIFFEIETLREKLLAAIQAYGNEKNGVAIAYDSHAYPYFFIDTNGNGKADTDEANFANQYNAWTSRLLKAAYNYQVSLKDPGAFAHGGKYIIQLITDSIEDVNSVLKAQVAMAGTSRNDEAHFDGATEAFRHWDEDGAVPGSCAKCHGGGGLVTYLENGVNVTAPFANGMLCSTCHDDPENFKSRRQVEMVEFPSGMTATLEDDSNLCMSCHQGRSSKGGVDDTIAASEGPYNFINIHYFPVAATLFGTEVEGGYEFDGKDYAGRNKFSSHADNYDTCVRCHMGSKGAEANKSHYLVKPNKANCVVCHGNDVSQTNKGSDADKFNFKEIRPGGFPDYDGDGDTDESLWKEMQGLETALFAEIQKYAKETIGTAIIYDSHAYPYFFVDTNGNGDIDEGEASFGNRFSLFDANLLRAAYNYQTSKKEPCGYIHNGVYVSQLLVDSIEALGGDVSEFTWR